MVPDEAHTWQFFRAGGVDQVLIRNGTDIARIGQLDQKLWVALACPASGIEIDPRTLALIDTDGDGRIRPPELIAACEWACRHLQDPDVLMQGGDTLALDAIADVEGEAVPLAEEARRILQLRGKEGADRLSLADVTDRSELLAAMRFNGDGVVPPESTDDEAMQTLLRRIMKTHGAARDRKGLDGVDRKRADAAATPDPLHAQQVKHLVTGNVVRILELALSATGNHGLDRANPLERHYRDALCGRVHAPQADTVLVNAGKAALGF